MAVGWAGDNAVNDQIQDSVNDEVKRARRNVPKVCNIAKNAARKFPKPEDAPFPASASVSPVRKKQTKNKKPSAFTTAAAAKIPNCADSKYKLY